MIAFINFLYTVFANVVSKSINDWLDGKKVSSPAIQQNLKDL